MPHVVVLESVDQSAHIAPRVNDDWTVTNLKSMWASSFNVADSDLLMRHDGQVVHDDQKTSELGIPKSRVVFLVVEQKEKLRLFLLPSNTHGTLPGTERADDYRATNGHLNGTIETRDKVLPRSQPIGQSQRSEGSNSVESAAWLSLPAKQLSEEAQRKFGLCKWRPLRLFLGNRELQLEQSLQAQDVDTGAHILVQQSFIGKH